MYRKEHTPHRNLLGWHPYCLHFVDMAAEAQGDQGHRASNLV